MNKYLLKLLLLLSIILSSYVHAAAYSIEDLRVLKSQNSYVEFFQHAHDIKPSERGEEWKKMTEQMGLAWLETLLSKPSLTNEDYEMVKAISQWPIFKTDEFFQEKRDAYFIKQLSVCGKGPDDNCFEQAKRIYLDYSHKLKFKAEFVKALYPEIINQAYIWDYVKPIAESKFGEFYCDDSPVSQIIISRLITHEKTKVHPDCLKVLKPVIVENYLSSPMGQSNQFYALLKRHGFLESNINRFEQTIQFLKGHSTDTTVLKELAESESMREELIQRFKNSPYLPDDVIQQKEPKKTASYLRILDRTFPEFLVMYSETCLDYLSGTKEFPLGNPTPQCHDLFSMKEIQSFLPTGHLQRYQKYTKFMR